MLHRASRTLRHDVAGSAALAGGVVLFEQILHSARGHEVMQGEHLALDTVLALPLAFLALFIGARVARRPSLRAPIVAAVFTAGLVPGVFAHGVLHAVTTAHAHVGAPGLAHGLRDALTAFPVALAIAAMVSMRPHRRRFVAVLGAVGVVATLPLPAVGAPIITPFARPLPIPPTLTSADITLTAQVTEVPVLAGAPTTMWTYNGTFPGPTIRRPSGTPTRVTVVNELPPTSGPLTLHHHGNHSAPEHDGQPHDYLIEPGASRTYTYDLFEDGAPERGAFQWYHDHHMDVTGRNVWMGLAGMVILDDPAEAAIDAQLPNGARDVPLMIADRRFDDANQIPYPASLDGALGTVILVNGAPQPFMEVADTRYRLRLLNASNARSYDFALSDGSSIVQVGTESGLLPQPITRASITLGPAERADVVVDFRGKLGASIVLQNRAAFGPNLSQAMQFRVVRDEEDASSVPSVLRQTPSFPPASVSTTRLWSFDRDPLDGRWTINGKGFEADRVDARPALGSVERWVFTNTTPVPHIVHIHDVDWRIESRAGGDGRLPGVSLEEPGLRESFRIAPNEVVSIVSRFTDHVGRYVLHCHILEHEDFAMMAQFEVVSP